MKTIKIHFLGFWHMFDYKRNMFTYILGKRYNLEFDSVNPDFLICSPICPPFEYMKYDCPRIMYTGEYLSADFTAIDYFIGYDNISFGDRAFRFPLYLYQDEGKYFSSQGMTEDEARKELKEKKYFCNYIFGHATQLGIREEILHRLMQYKRVECAGKHCNNMPNGEIYTLENNDILIKRCKFTISAESVSYPGFTSEKLARALRAKTIPIYYGDPLVENDFNGKAFINCNNYKSIDDVVERVIEIDKNDDLWISTMCEAWYHVSDYENKKFKELEEFLYHIFDQEKETAYRRPRYYRAGMYEKTLLDYNEYQSSKIYKISNKLKRIFKKK